MIEGPEPPLQLHSLVTENLANTEASDEVVPMWKQRTRIFIHNKLAVASVLFIMATVI